MRLRLTEDAASDLETIKQFSDDIDAGLAARILAQIGQVLSLLKRFPHIGHDGHKPRSDLAEALSARGRGQKQNAEGWKVSHLFRCSGNCPTAVLISLHVLRRWCPGEDSNLHTLAGAST